ncbi:hypothetical protein DXG01_016612 [Tephrocybe rancida]|nr:hypothetical protein DXG01_016612 [Tephrocybe rancida]
MGRFTTSSGGGRRKKSIRKVYKLGNAQVYDFKWKRKVRVLRRKSFIQGAHTPAMSSSFDKRLGKVSVLDGQLYYSPNCSRNVKVPPVTDDSQIKLFHLKAAQAENYYQPRWWSRSYGWLAFVPLNPMYIGPVLGRLRVPTSLNNIRPKGAEDFRFEAPDDLRKSWGELDYNLTLATAILSNEYKWGGVRPFSPWSLGYCKRYIAHNYAVAQLFKSRNWFSIWMGLLSYIIARAETSGTVAIPWRELLTREGFDVSWIDAVASSTICDFTARTHRVGTFVDIFDPDAPKVTWMCLHQVPVWYKWGTDEASNTTLRSLAPLTHQLQSAATVLTVVPTPPMSSTIVHMDNLPTTPANEPDPPRAYFAFFAAREARNARRLVSETVADRQIRLNRERKPPKASAKVFIWEADESNPTHWVRVPVRKIDREQTLGEYSGEMSRYDSFTNEWDCCEEFGPPEREDEDFGVTDFLREDSPVDPTLDTEAPFPDLGPRPLTPPAQPAQILDAERYHVPHFLPVTKSGLSLSLVPPGPADLWQQEVLEILFVYYGYTPPLPLPTSAPRPPMGIPERRKLVRLLGLSWDQSEQFVASPAASLAKAYLDEVISHTRPTGPHCDFNARSRIPVAASQRFQSLRVITTIGPAPRNLYMFDFRKTAQASWSLAMMSAADALMVCRLDPSLNEHQLASYLLLHGIPFKTLLPSHLAKQALRGPPPPCTIPIRLSGTSFSTKDYDSYAELRAQILQQPRARAALLRGGFIWRLCCDVVSFEAVLQGPTGWSSSPGTMLIAIDPQTQEEFIDDALTDVELDLISGTYACYTGIGLQLAMRSWFPSIATFEAGGEDYGRWNTYREDGFLKRLDEINNPAHSVSSRGPMTANKWRDLVRGMRESRVLKDNIEKWSYDFIAAMKGKQKSHIKNKDFWRSKWRRLVYGGNETIRQVNQGDSPLNSEVHGGRITRSQTHELVSDTLAKDQDISSPQKRGTKTLQGLVIWQTHMVFHEDVESGGDAESEIVDDDDRVVYIGLEASVPEYNVHVRATAGLIALHENIFRDRHDCVATIVSGFHFYGLVLFLNQLDFSPDQDIYEIAYPGGGDEWQHG